jgi:putative restriction endonuclease
MSLAAYEDKLRQLNVNQSGGRNSPHKICMLLAVLDLARSGALTENRIEYSPALLERFGEYFDAVRAPGDHPKPNYPFFHLKGPLQGRRLSFWHLKAKPGRESVLRAMRSARSPRDIEENVDFAYLDDELFHLLQDPECIDRLSATLAETWFHRGLDELGKIVDIKSQVSNYERRLRQLGKVVKDETRPPAFVRDPAFRRVVTEMYDYRCAATGLRLVLPDGCAMVEAAHIIPFGSSGDDDPRNGLALTPDMHWAMDQYLIAPDTNYRWQVSSRLDTRIPDHQVFSSLAGKPLILPKEARWYPRRDALEWRVKAMRLA